jgi:hypothetical protein
MFLYFEGPDGMVYEYSTGVRLMKKEEEGAGEAAIPSYGSQPISVLA